MLKRGTAAGAVGLANLAVPVATLVAATVAFGTFMVAQASAASAVRCPGHTYGSIDPSAFPNVSNLRAINLPRKTTGYAPRCLVAESVAGMIQVYAQDHNGRIPTKVRVMGARWNAGTWRVRYRVVQGEDSPYGKFTATQGSKRITFDGAS
jgi:hypothetical protein